jgi:hypothetical protein
MPTALSLLAALLPHARSHAEDWRTGIEDGTYEDEAGLPELEQALDEADALLKDGEPTGDNERLPPHA